MWICRNPPPGASDPKTPAKNGELQGTSQSVLLKPRPKPTKSLSLTLIHVYTQTTHRHLIVMQFVTQRNEKYLDFRNGILDIFF